MRSHGLHRVLIGRSPDAACAFLRDAPHGTNLELASFRVTNTQFDQRAAEAVVAYEAAIEVTPPDREPTPIIVTQDVGLDWRSDRWLIPGADSARVSGTMPGTDV